MKTSNKLLLATAIIILGYLVTYDLALRAEYIKGDFRGQFYHMHHVPVNNFNAIEHNAGNIFAIRVQKGPEFAVWLSDGAEKGISISQHDKTIYIDCKDKHYRNVQETDVVITCPTVNSITVNPMVTAEKRYWMQSTKIVGLNQDSISITANKSNIELNKNTLAKLNARIDGHNVDLTITKDNTIALANLKALGKSQLKLFNPIINKANYTFTDSTEVTLTGSRVLQQLQTGQMH